MQLLLELLPVGAFFATYFLFGRDIYLATMVLMAGMTLSLLILWIRSRRIPALFGASTALVLVFGAATLWLRNPKFIQWKPTIFLWVMALAFLASQFIGKVTLAQRILQPMLGESQLDRPDWLKLNWSWITYGAIAGLANIVAAYHVSQDAWVSVKGIGLTVSMFLFLLAQIYWLHRRGKLNLS
jgi:intracellular septation protein